MLFYHSLITYFHFIGIFILISTLILEYVLFEKSLSNNTAKLISQADVWYGISAVIIVISGLLKLFYFGKGSTYYINNSIFWGKMALFSIIGLLSIMPTIRFIKWRKKIKQGEGIQLNELEFKRTKRIILLEIIFFLFIPFLATLMARGFGYYG